MNSNSLFFQIPIAVFSISIVITWLNAAQIYKKMNPNEDFSLFSDQLFLFRKVNRNNPLASKYNKRRITILVIIGLSIVHGIIFNILSIP